MYFFAMKLFFMIYSLWIITLAKGVPDHNEQRLQPRNISDWFYGDNLDSDRKNSKTPEDISKDEDLTNVIISVDEAEPNDKIEPIENLLKELKEKGNKESTDSKSINKEDNNITSLLKDLNKTIADTPNKLAKIFVNKTWRIFDIGALGSSRRTRNVEETTYLGSIFNLFNWFSQLLSPVYSQEEIDKGNAALHQAFNSIASSTKQNSPKMPKVQPAPPKKQNASENTEFKMIVNEENKKMAADLYNAETGEEMISKIKKSLNGGNLDMKNRFYILLALDQLYDRLRQMQNNETKLDAIYLIINVGDDGKFKELFDTLAQSKNRDNTALWSLFQNHRTRSRLYDRIHSIENDIREKKLKEQPLPENCLITGPLKKVSEQGEGENKRIITTIHSWNAESEDDNYKLCIEDNSETEVNELLNIHNDATGDDLLKIIKSRLNDLEGLLKFSKTIQFRWSIIVKLYKMLENIGSNQEEYKKNIVKLMTKVNDPLPKSGNGRSYGKDRKFDRIFESLQATEKPRFQKIWEAFKNNPQQEDEKSEWWNTGFGFRHYY